MHLLNVRPTTLADPLKRALPVAELCGPDFVNDAALHQMSDGALRRMTIDRVTGRLIRIADHSNHGRHITPLSTYAPLVSADLRPPRGQAEVALDFNADATLSLGAGFPVAGAWTKVICFRPDLAAMGSDHAMLWRADNGNSNVHRLSILNGLLYHYVGSGGTNVSRTWALTSSWTWAAASWNHATKDLRLSVGGAPPVSITGTTESLGNANHWIGGDNVARLFRGQIGPFGLFLNDIFDPANAALLERVTKFCEAAIGQ